MPKYKLTKQKQKLHNGTTLYRIQCCETFRDAYGRIVPKGVLGGLVESEDNLSQDGHCWITYAAIVCDNARISEDAMVEGWTIVYGNAKMYGNASICGTAQLYGNAQAYDNCKIYESAKVYGNSTIRGCAQVYVNARVYGNATIFGQSRVYHNARVYGNSLIGSTNTTQPFYIGFTDEMSKDNDFGQSIIMSDYDWQYKMQDNYGFIK